MGWSAACLGLERQRSFPVLVLAELSAWDRDEDKSMHIV